MFKSVFVSSYLDKQKAITSLLAESRDNSDFYFLLALASFIATLGLLINNTIIVLGGMLVAPLLFPILSLAMAIITSSRLAIYRGLKIIFRAIILILIVSFITSFLFAEPDVVSNGLLGYVMPDLFLFLISFATGLAVSFSWVRKDLSATLPGVAVSVSLIIPLVSLAIGITLLDKVIIAGSITLFLINILAIVFAGMVVFSLFGFSNLQAEEEEKITEEELENKIHQEAIAEAKTSEIVDTPSSFS